MKTLKKYVKIYILIQKFNIVREMTYRVDFVAVNFLNIIYLMFRWFGFKFVYQEIPVIGGYTFNQIMIYLAITQFIWFISQVFIRKGVQEMIEAVNNGNFDFYLVKPINTLFYSINIGSRMTDIVPVIYYALFYFYVCLQAGADIAKIFFSLLYVLLGAGIFMLLVLFVGLLSLHFGQVGMIQSVFPNLTELAKMPFSFIPKGIAMFFITLLPLSLTTEPAYRVAMDQDLGSLGYVLILVLLLWIGIDYYLYKTGLIKYSSAGG